MGFGFIVLTVTAILALEQEKTPAEAGVGEIGSPRGIRTPDLRLERAVSWAARRWGHRLRRIKRAAKNIWLAIQDSNLGFQIQSLTSYRWTNRDR